MDRKLIAGLALGTVAVLAACSSAGTPAGTSAAGGGGGGAPTAAPGGSTPGTANGGGGGSTPSDPCAIVSQQEVAAAINEPVVAGTNVQDSHECDWFYPTSDSLTGATLTIQGGDLASYCGETSNPALGLNIEQVSGVGDGACFSYVTGTTVGSNLTFAKNGHVYSTTVFFGGGTPIETVRDAAKALALAALAHL